MSAVLRDNYASNKTWRKIKAMRTKNATRLKGQWGGGGLRMMPLPSPGFQIYIHYVLTIGGFFVVIFAATSHW